jgi:hypothetical protein
MVSVDNAIMYAQIFRNLPGNPNWEGSFYEKLTEHGNWCIEEFWKLHLDLVEAAQIQAHAVTIDRELALAVATLYARISNLVSAHYNINDVFQIGNLSENELLNFTERLEHAILGVFSGRVIPESSYDVSNPLVTT